MKMIDKIGAKVLITCTCWYSSLHFILWSSVQKSHVLYLWFPYCIKPFSCQWPTLAPELSGVLSNVFNYATPQLCIN